MKKRVKVVAVLVTIITVMTNICAYASTIHVNLDGLTRENEVLGVDFDYVAPTNTDGISMVPIRTVCEDAGMRVMWQEYLNAVVVILNAKQNSFMPIEKHAFEILKKKADYEELNLQPSQIIMTMYLDSQNATLHYNYKDAKGKTVSYGRYIGLPKPVQMAENGVLTAPIRPMFNYFGLWIEWNNDERAVNIKIPMFVSFVAEMNKLATYEPNENDGKVKKVAIPKSEVVIAELEAAKTEAVSVETVSTENNNDGRVYLGNFRISHYCSCSKCCGPYVGQTAWGGPLRADYTIAVDPKVIPKLSSVVIDGYEGIRVAEDCGGAIKGNRIDVAVSSHEEAMRLGVVYRDVWIVK